MDDVSDWVHVELSNCVACESNQLIPILDLGEQPLANDYRDSEVKPKKFPLKLNICEICTHAQLSLEINPKILFSNYNYASGISETMGHYFSTLRDRIIKSYGESGKLLEVGSNDGAFLQKFNNTSWNVIGVDPAANLVIDALQRRVQTIPTFFSQNIATFLAKDFDVIVAMNVFAHSARPIEILNAMESILSSNGTAYILTSQADMFLNYEFDTVYHEHISFFNVKSMRALLKRAGWKLVNVSIENIHGNSYLWEISKGTNSGPSKKFEREIFEEVKGMHSSDFYLSFEYNVRKITSQVVSKIDEYRARGYVLASYGAAAKGNTFINFTDLSLDFIFDDTPHKIGKFAPAGNCIVENPSQMVKVSEKVLFVIPAWNFVEEILEKIRALRKGNDDSYLVYFPRLRIEKIYN